MAKIQWEVDLISWSRVLNFLAVLLTDIKNRIISTIGNTVIAKASQNKHGSSSFMDIRIEKYQSIYQNLLQDSQFLQYHLQKISGIRDFGRGNIRSLHLYF